MTAISTTFKLATLDYEISVQTATQMTPESHQNRKCHTRNAHIRYIGHWRPKADVVATVEVITGGGVTTGVRIIIGVGVIIGAGVITEVITGVVPGLVGTSVEVIATGGGLQSLYSAQTIWNDGESTHSYIHYI